MTGFSFGFSSNDIEDGASEDEHQTNLPSPEAAGQQQDLLPPKLHTLQEMLFTLPSSISYSIHTISEDPLLRLPRRDLFDIRAQLLAEADVSDAASTTLAEGLMSDDIRPRFYEGGFKTWECSFDLARLLVKQSSIGRGSDWVNIVEIGAGTVLPSCTVLNDLLERYPLGSAYSVEDSGQRTLVIADYNYQVLTHASLPNLILTFAHSCGLQTINHTLTDHGELEVTNKVLEDFQYWLAKVGLTIFGVSGAWSPRFNELIDQVLGQGNRLVLASETIYQPDSLLAFTSVLLSLLNCKNQAISTNRALVAAKKIYFGVGGGIDEFLSCLRVAGGQASVEWESGDTGVGRVILNVKVLD